MTQLVLASTSPARLTLLRNAGIEPITISPGVDEDAVAARAEAMGLIANTSDRVHVLAKAKAGDATAQVRAPRLASVSAFLLVSVSAAQ